MQYTNVFYLLSSYLLVFLICFSLNAQENKQNGDEPAVVNSVDLDRYIGMWYEIAKIPNRFQKDCARNTTATYTLREDGRIDVVNRCFEEDGTKIEAKGIARIVDTNTNAKLKVSFVRILGISLFWGDYWVIGLEENYRYAIVGTPSRKYGWILSRQPQLYREDLDEIFTILKNQGYNPDDFIMTEQTY
jgi:apolipoprotein D and lipocalin family protein